MTDLTIVPDETAVHEDELLSEEVSPEQVNEVADMLEKQNVALLNRLQILGKAVNPLLLLKLEHDVLLDFVLGDDEARNQYNTAVSMRLNEALKVTIAELVGAEVDG